MKWCYAPVSCCLYDTERNYQKLNEMFMVSSLPLRSHLHFSCSASRQHCFGSLREHCSKEKFLLSKRALLEKQFLLSKRALLEKQFLRDACGIAATLSPTLFVLRFATALLRFAMPAAFSPKFQFSIFKSQIKQCLLQSLS